MDLVDLITSSPNAPYFQFFYLQTYPNGVQFLYGALMTIT